MYIICKLRLFEHLYVEIANMSSCSAFEFTKHSEKIKNVSSIDCPPKSRTKNFL